MKKAIQEVSQETLKIEEYFKSLSPGTRLSYKTIEESTGVKMDNQGKGYLRSASKRLSLPYLTRKGDGIEILSANNASAIVSNSVIKIDRSVKRAEKTTKNVRNRVYDELPNEERKTIDVLGALFGSIRMFSTPAKRLFSKQKPKAGEVVYDKQKTEIK